MLVVNRVWRGLSSEKKQIHKMMIMDQRIAAVTYMATLAIPELRGVTAAASKSSELADWNREVVKETELRSCHLQHPFCTRLYIAQWGYTDEGPSEGKPSISTHLALKAFLLLDGISFYSSTAAFFLHVFASLEQNYHLLLRFIKFSAILTDVSILGMVTAFTSGIYLVLPNSSEAKLNCCICAWVFVYELSHLRGSAIVIVDVQDLPLRIIVVEFVGFTYENYVLLS